MFNRLLQPWPLAALLWGLALSACGTAEGPAPDEETVVLEAELFQERWQDGGATLLIKSVDGRFAVNTSITATFPVGRLGGVVTDVGTGSPIPFTATALERGFEQTVPDSGRYEFRFMAHSTSGSAETTTVIFEADGYARRHYTLTAAFIGESFRPQLERRPKKRDD